ncbi:MAG TPA: carbamoyltransferase C-terminal domain-containing protein [Dehalococcoidia bacterium]|nr:carbamoyltransferase C-terminal domain-containing protein [Dehalococcoidia bacterium]
MRILGIHDAIDSGAAIMEDGKIIAAVGEERVIRSKLAYGFPREAIRTVLEVANLGPADIDEVAVATRNNYLVNAIVPFKGWYETRNNFFRSLFMSAAFKISPLAVKLGFLEKLYYSLRNPIFANRRRQIPLILKREFGISCPVDFVDHHLSHAASAYYSAPYRDATVVTLDGGGDGLSAAVYAVRNGRFEKLSQNSSLNSIGNFYSYVTHICGFTTHKHEGKITGLAAYGEPKHVDIFRSLMVLREGRIINSSKLFGSNAIKRIKDLLPEDFSPADLAASIQLFLEEVVTEYIRYWTQRTGLGQLALAGGVFANVKVNQRLHELDTVDSVFIHPAMGDDGIAAGAALAHYYGSHAPEELEVSRCLEQVYFGPQFSDEAIERDLELNGLEYTSHQDIEYQIARLLSEGYVVARFNGRMEYGPRALGNRSILYQPTDHSVNDWLNKGLDRTEFMPFAPSTLQKYTDQCFKDVRGAEDAARFMTITFNCTDWMKEHCQGVVHIDNTARPQLVSQDDNPSYYKIIDEYRKLTGLPTVVNTSFNIHEEPIVCTPSDAIRAFKMGHLDYLAIGNFLVKNPMPITRALVPSARAEVHS